MHPCWNSVKTRAFLLVQKHIPVVSVAAELTGFNVNGILDKKFHFWEAVFHSLARREDSFLNLVIGGDFLREAGVLEFANVV